MRCCSLKGWFPTCTHVRLFILVKWWKVAAQVICDDWDFEADTLNLCPSGWTCFGSARVKDPNNMPSGCPVSGGASGSKVLLVGCDAEEGKAVSNTFQLPASVVSVTYLRSGGADSPSGLYVKEAGTDNLLASDIADTNTDVMFERTLDVSAYAGRSVYLEIEDVTQGIWAKVVVDNIRIIAISCDSGSVGGDPITTYNGIETKFTIPVGRMTTLFRTSEVVVQASPIPGEQNDEQWIGRVLVSSTSGVVIADIQIRSDLESFAKENISNDDFETIVVKAPWHEEKWLKFPVNAMVAAGKALLVRNEIFEPIANLRLQLIRFRMASDLGFMGLKGFRTSVGVLPLTPHNEGVLFETKDVSFLVSSVPALEYYWADANDARSLRFAHLDMNFFNIRRASECQGLLPELWGVRVSVNVSNASVNGRRQSDAEQQLQHQILSTLV